MSATIVFGQRDVSATRAVVAALIPHLRWRRHGIGVLQAYVREGEREVRVHVWSRSLMLDGIERSGNAHNHRFSMRSTVLVGLLDHVEYRLGSGDEFELYDFVHARIQTDANRASMRKLTGVTGAERIGARIGAGQSYTFERGAFHTSTPVSDVVVTLVEKFDQVDEKARVLAPAGVPPVPAFGGPPLGPGELEDVLAAAIVAIERCDRSKP